jgi:hypothetical protein
MRCKTGLLPPSLSLECRAFKRQNAMKIARAHQKMISALRYRETPEKRTFSASIQRARADIDGVSQRIPRASAPLLRILS